MKRLLILILLSISLAACVSEVKRHAANDTFISQSSPPLHFNFQGFTLKEEKVTPAYLDYSAKKYYVWEDQEGKRIIEIAFHRLPKGFSSYRDPLNIWTEMESLCVGTTKIEDVEYKTRTRVNPRYHYLSKTYVHNNSSDETAVLIYVEQISQAETAAFAYWQSKKEKKLLKSGEQVGQTLKNIRQETFFENILEFEKRADDLFTATKTNLYVEEDARVLFK